MYIHYGTFFYFQRYPQISVTISSWCSFAKCNLGSRVRGLMFLHFMKHHKAGYPPPVAAPTMLTKEDLHFFFLVFMS